MELPSKLLNKAYNTRNRTEEHMLIVMDKSTREEHLPQQLQTYNKQFKKAITSLSGYSGIFNVTNLNNNFSFKKSFNDGDFIQIGISPGACEIESFNVETKRIFIDKGHYSESNYPFNIKPNFSTLGSIVEIYQSGPIFSFETENSIGKLLGCDETILYNEYNSSPNPVDILSFDNIFTHTDIAQGMIFKGKRSGINQNFTMDADPGYKYIEKFRGGLQWYMLNTKDFISSVNFKIKSENDELVSFNGQSITFRLSIKEIKLNIYLQLQ